MDCREVGHIDCFAITSSKYAPFPISPIRSLVRQRIAVEHLAHLHDEGWRNARFGGRKMRTDCAYVAISAPAMDLLTLPDEEKTSDEFALGDASAVLDCAREQSSEGDDPHEIAKDLLRELRRSVGDSNYRNWFDGRLRMTVSRERVTLGVGSPFLMTWMQKQFRSSVSDAVESTLGPATKIEWCVDTDVISHNTADASKAPVAKTRGSASSTSPNSPEAERSAQTDAESEFASQRTTRSSGSNGSSSAKPIVARRGRRFADLSDFVGGPCNQLALTAARQVCDSPSAQFNPLFLHGPVGTGKTHLLEGIYRGLRRTHRSLSVTYITAEAFANYFTQALREHSLPGFRQRFRNVDVLLIDDVDFLESKRVMQEEFLHTFKRLEDFDRQIIIASNRHPKLLTKFSDELTSRFVSGLVCRLEVPGANTRLDIVRRKSAKLDGVFSDATLSYVADRFRGNVRELEGALNALDSLYSMTRKRVELSTARKLLSELERDCIRVVKVKDIERTVCDFFGLEADDLRSTSRQRLISQPRMLAMYLSRKHTQAAYREIGQHFGGRNHSTVVSAEKKIRGWIESNSEVQVAAKTWSVCELLESLEQHLQAG